MDARDEATAIRGATKTLRVPLELLHGAPKLAVVRTPKWSIATEAQRNHFDQCVAMLRDAGAAVREVPLPRAFDDAWANVMTILARDAVKSFAAIESRHRIRLSPPLIQLLDRGHAITPEAYARARTKREDYRRWFDGLFDGYDAIVTIPAPGEAPEGLSNTGDATFCSLWTLTGLPAVTIPSGRGPRGLPLGLQVVGRYREDERALQVAAWCESIIALPPALAGD
jgi:amidase